ncbi:MAG: hypothetical protein M3018_08065 [Actinomycetota bacterium]|nr:hypothetical protein [Actinomycetota bacterium]
MPLEQKRAQAITATPADAQDGPPLAALCSALRTLGRLRGQAHEDAMPAAGAREQAVEPLMLPAVA